MSWRKWLVAILGLAVLPAQASLGPCGSLTVGFYEHGALYYRTAQGWTGIDKEVIDELGRRTGCQFLGTLESSSRIWSAMRAGNLALTVSTIPTAERESFGRSVIYMASRQFAVLHKSVPPTMRSSAAFLGNENLRVGVVRNFRHSPSYENWLNKLRSQGRVYEAPDMPALVRLLKLGRVHALVLLPTARTELKQQGVLQDVEFQDWTASQERVRIGLLVSRQLVPAERVAQFEQAIHAMREDGTLEAIFRRHLGPELGRSMANF